MASKVALDMVSDSIKMAGTSVLMPNCHIAGFNPVTLVDYPGKVASTVFLQGCNLRCRYCHNPELVLPISLNDQSDAFFKHIHNNLVENIAITGGEPLNSPNIFDFLYFLKSKEINIKLDTNGSNPAKLQKVIDAGLLDYVAMDIKGMCDEDISFITRGKFKFANFLDSLKVLETSSVEFELRFTLWKNWDECEIKLFRDIIGEPEKIVLQKLNTNTKMLDKRFKHLVKIDFESQIILFKKFFQNITSRG